MTMASEGLTCSICYERFDDQNLCPRLLSCGHSFCTSCLERLLQGNAIKCPTCRNAVSVPAGVAGLPTNFPLLLLDIANATPQHAGDGGLHFCEACDVEQHPAIFRCLDCKKDMCKVAAGFHTRSKASRDHRVVSKFRQGMELIVTKGSNYVEQIKAAEARVTGVRVELKEAYKETATKIQGTFQELYATLATREKFLMNKLDQLHKTKAVILKEQQDRLHVFQARLESVVQRAKSTIPQTTGNAELLVARSDMESTLRAIESQSPVLEPQADCMLEVTFDDRQLLAVLNNVGVVSSKSTCEETATATNRRSSIVFEPGVSHR